MTEQQKTFERVSTGIDALDEILRGGLPKGEMYVVGGEAGAGKTTLALHFLKAGVDAKEKVVFLALSQRVESIRHSAASVGLDVSGIKFQDLSTVESLKALSDQQTIFDTSEIELSETVNAIIDMLEEEQPDRVVFDGIAYLRMLADNPLIYRQQVFKLRDYISPREITLLLTDTRGLAPGDRELSAMAHGVLELTLETTRQGNDYRYLHVSKLRGSGFASGKHDMEITDSGIHIYRSHQSLSVSNALAQAKKSDAALITSGLPSLDKLVGGGLLAGTSCLMLGPSGTGKSSMTTLFAHNFAAQGGKASFFLFDETVDTFMLRSKGLGMDMKDLVDKGQVRLRELSFGDVTPRKFASLINEDVDGWGAGIVVIDTLTGYLNSMPSESWLIAQMHEIIMGLNRRGVLTFLVVAQRGVIGPELEETVDISYLADTVLLLRHFEAEGAIRQAISVYKKRFGDHEKRIREIRMRPGSIQIGESLSQVSGILSRVPRYRGEGKDLFLDDEGTGDEWLMAKRGHEAKRDREEER